MKIGIITFHRAINYGAYLQAYALKQVLMDLSAQVDIIDYRSKKIERSYYSPIHSWESIKTNIKNIVTWKAQSKRNQAFAPFFDKYIFSGENKIIYSSDKLKEISNQYDAFISGSDQVWNLRCNTGDMAYLLDFVKEKKKKFSYAASFGYVIEDDYRNSLYKNLISEFEFKSVREQKGIDVIYKLLGSKCGNIAKHIDPTFLIGLDQWKKFVKPIDQKNKYVLVYSLTMPPKMLEYAEQVAEANHLEVVIITLNNLFTLTTKHKVITASPEQFLSYINFAECILTNSFHGTAFSIIFRKKFRVLLNRNPQHDNGRILDLLNTLDLSSTIIDESDQVIDFRLIDYEIVDGHLQKLRQQALDYLNWILGGKYDIFNREY